MLAACFRQTANRSHTAQATQLCRGLIAQRRLESTHKPAKEHSISLSARKLNIPWQDGKTSSFHHIWLRDHCRSKSCFHPVTHQRLLDTSLLPRDIAPTNVEQGEEGLTLTWPDAHQSYFSYDWLHRHSYSPKFPRPDALEAPQHFWGSEIKESLPTIAYDDIMASDEGVGRWLTQIHTYGFSLVDGTPIDPAATQALLERIAFIRQTHYGGFYDFTADLAHGDLAYTNVALPPHNDTTYFSDPAGLQMFHLLAFDGTGGESLLVDGFKAAKQLRQDHPKAYSTLSRVRVPTHSAGDVDKCITPSIGGGAFPILNHDPATGLLSQVRYNNEDRSTMTSFTDDREVEDFYEALQVWHTLLVSPAMMLQFPMKPGQALIFDNWRVLHGRTQFDATKRRICGGYISMDDYQSRRKLTTRGREAVMFDL
ncbi:hypothetical protein BCR37DRAFT_1216 [Protomyces lactucae-debilis]|uniref:Trimethyllysine dioxygenase n=1 Tax=Protomyces lactucae-debilis TaxID=2754530 RepID=A0A1Y2FU83_PROLT|nr:uncharacterized protein BCR37DRAFT_1216 [Protomyces lactucae-debilis]ORY87573.1 hypothetical protein BCR37DRAFT_1216 [Protomyces lactucae-debilis]